MGDPPTSTQPTRDYDNEHPAAVDAEGNASNNGSFLVHSSKTLTTALPPKVDNKVFSRQRRRRTSPEDHAVLEAEYQRNPKPDKITRANIVSRVSLGDKEVQIWFQNRRQNDRRRSKPLQPHELLPPGSGVINSRVSDERSTVTAGAAAIVTEHERRTGTENSFSKPSLSPNTSFEYSTDSEGNRAGVSSPVDSSQTTIATENSEAGGNGGAHTSRLPSNNEPPLPAPGRTSPAGKRKRSVSDLRGESHVEHQQALPTTSRNFVPPSLRISLSFDGEAIVRNEDEKTPSPPKVRDPVRISFSADGEAVIRTAHEPSPSKNPAPAPAAQQCRSGTLRRCHSAVTLGTSSGVSSLRDKLFGRSRDARAWERFCDNDARSGLSPNSTAGYGANGFRFNRSARGLLKRRKSEAGHIKSPLARTGLSNAVVPTSGPPPEKRTKLSRTVSSLGRLESETRYATTTLSGVKEGATKDSAKNLEIYEDGDSDKENWIPGTRISSTQQRRPTTNRRRSGLGPMSVNARGGAGNPQVLAKTRRPNGVRTQPSGNIKTGSRLAEDRHGIVHEEQPTSQVDDLDCVQGLLSLSQGAWG